MINKILSLLIFLIILSTCSFSQNIDYKITATANYSFFTLSFYPKKTNDSYYCSYSSYSNYYNNYTYSGLIRIIETESVGKAGFYLNNDFSFPINKHLSFKTGFGLSSNNVDHKTTFSTDFKNINIGQDSITIINPFFLSDANTLTSLISEYDSTSLYFLKSNLNILSINIPMQLEFKLFNQNLIIASGISIAQLISVINTPETNSKTIRKYTAEGDFEKSFINFQSSIQYKVYKNIYASISFTRSISDIKIQNKDNLPNTYPYFNFASSFNKLHLNSLSFGISYKI